MIDTPPAEIVQFDSIQIELEILDGIWFQGGPNPGLQMFEGDPISNSI